MASKDPVLEAYERQNRINPDFRKETVSNIRKGIRWLNTQREKAVYSWDEWNSGFVGLGEQIGALPRTPEVTELVREYNASYGFSTLG